MTRISPGVKLMKTRDDSRHATAENNRTKEMFERRRPDEEKPFGEGNKLRKCDP
jgi:hypothetical protein